MIPLLFALPFMAIVAGTKIHEDGERRDEKRKAHHEQNYQLAIQSSTLFRESEIQKIIYSAKAEYDGAEKQLEYQKRLEKARASSTLAFYDAQEQGLSPDQCHHKGRRAFGRTMKGLQDPHKDLFVSASLRSYKNADELLDAIKNGTRPLHGTLSDKELNRILSTDNLSDLADENSSGDGA